MNTEPSTERHEERLEKSYGPTILMGVLLIFAVVFIVTVTSSNTSGTNPLPPTGGQSPQSVSPPQTTSTAITNPDYNSTDIVDRTGTVPSQIPTDKALWVEQILSPTQIEVSYIITRGGSNIIELKPVSIQGLYWPEFDSSGNGQIVDKTAFGLPRTVNDGDCWTQKVQAFLTQNILHQKVYLSGLALNDLVNFAKPTSDSPYNGVDLLIRGANGTNTSLATFIISNGYGFVYEGTSLYSSSSAGTPSYEPVLYSDQQVASLAKRGAWGVCGGA